VTELSPSGIVGVDIGGANLKYARIDRVAVSTTFPMWRQPEHLANAIAKDLLRLAGTGDTPGALAVTMTGELADCFVDRVAGVRHIVSQACEAARRLGIDEVSFYAVDGRFCRADQALKKADLVASANWHALASFVAEEIAADATLIDIGSTTTDIIPLANGRVDTTAQTDHDRLQEGSLVYVGCRRTPICALVNELHFHGRRCSVMNELFATIDDARLVLGNVDEDTEDCDTADGRPRTRHFASSRLVRMIGLDRPAVSLAECQDLAAEVVGAAMQRIHLALEKFAPDGAVVLSGHGQDLIDLPAARTAVQLSELVGAQVARCAPSYAVASLYAREVEARTGCDA
jgi:hypothetical protein